MENIEYLKKLIKRIEETCKIFKREGTPEQINEQGPLNPHV